VPVLVVHDLEVVDVHTDNRQWLLVHALALGQSLFEHHVETARIRQFRQRIDKSTLARSLVSQSIVESTRSVLANGFEQTNVFTAVRRSALGVQRDCSKGPLLAQ
jgi:hypothetical protein